MSCQDVFTSSMSVIPHLVTPPGCADVRCFQTFGRDLLSNIVCFDSESFGSILSFAFPDETNKGRTVLFHFRLLV